MPTLYQELIKKQQSQLSPLPFTPPKAIKALKSNRNSLQRICRIRTKAGTQRHTALSPQLIPVISAKIPEDLMPLITCQPGVARVIYKGELKPGKYLRAELPIPTGGLTGKVKIKATFCYASQVDPQDASTYTRAGLEVTFRPNEENVKDKTAADGTKAGKKDNAETKSFFQLKQYATEEERRSDMGKWETVLHAEKSMLGKGLNHPVFDIHYNAREAGQQTGSADKIPYALVITIEAPRHADLFNDILRTYSTILTPIQPRVSLPIRT